MVIDRCNHNAMQRSHWLHIARHVRKGSGIRLLALVLELPAELCVQRAEARGAHATLPAAQAREVIQRFVTEWQAPTRKERFDGVRVARTSEEAEAAAASLLRSAAVPVAVPAWTESAGMAGATEAVAVEPAVPQPAVRAHRDAGAPAFNAGTAWLAPAQAPQVQHPGWGQQTTQQGRQQQQRQPYTTRADAAGSWQRGGDGAAADGAAGTAAAPASPQRRGGSRWDEQQQGSSSGSMRSGQQDGHAPQSDSPTADSSAGGNIVPFPRRRSASRERTPPHQQMHHSQPGHHAAHDKHRPRPHPWQRYRHDEPSGFWLDANTGTKPILMFDANGARV